MIYHMNGNPVKLLPLAIEGKPIKYYLRLSSYFCTSALGSGPTIMQVLSELVTIATGQSCRLESVTGDSSQWLETRVSDWRLESVTGDSSQWLETQVSDWRLKSVILRLETWSYGLETWLVACSLELGTTWLETCSEWLGSKVWITSPKENQVRVYSSLGFDIAIKYIFSISCLILLAKIPVESLMEWVASETCALLYRNIYFYHSWLND